MAAQVAGRVGSGGSGAGHHRAVRRAASRGLVGHKRSSQSAVTKGRVGARVAWPSAASRMRSLRIGCGEAGVGGLCSRTPLGLGCGLQAFDKMLQSRGSQE
jgi:hypothetical protein